MLREDGLIQINLIRHRVGYHVLRERFLAATVRQLKRHDGILIADRNLLRACA